MDLSYSKKEFDHTNIMLEGIVSSPTETIEVELESPPKIDDLSDSNKSYKIKCAILFIDIRGSTDLSDASHAKSMVKIYRSFMRMTVECVRKSGGVTRQFLGDRIMGIFLDDVNEEGKIETKAVDKAVFAARMMITLLDYSLNPLLNKHMKYKAITCGVGISYGEVLATQVGMRGVESDDSKENEKDLVWVGKITNHASKFADLTSSGEVFISEKVYSKLSNSNKFLNDNEVWMRVTRPKGNSFYNGFVAEDYYLDNVDSFESICVKCKEDIALSDSFSDLLLGLQSNVNSIMDDMTKRVTEISKKENRVDEKVAQYKKKLEVVNIEKEELYSAKRDFSLLLSKHYGYIRSIFQDSFLNHTYIKSIELEKWENIFKNLIETSKMLGNTKYDVEVDICHYLIGIYIEYGDYDSAYNYLCIMAKESSWLSFYEKVLPNTSKFARLESIVRDRVEATTDNEKKKEYADHLEAIRKIIC